MAGEAMSTSAAAAAAAGGGAGGGAGGATGAKPKKKICCACPETKTARDNCIVENGEDERKRATPAARIRCACVRWSAWLERVTGATSEMNARSLTDMSTMTVERSLALRTPR